MDDLPAEPSYMAVQKLVDEFKASGADLIVACGGGSVMDAAKLASILVTDEYGVKELLDQPGRAKKCVPIILDPHHSRDRSRGNAQRHRSCAGKGAEGGHRQ